MSRVLHVAQPTDGGVAGVVVQLVADQVRAGWDVAVACPPTGPLAVAAADAGARVLTWPAARGIGPSTVEEAVRLRYLLTRENPDLVHLHSAKAGLAGRLALRGRCPTIFQPHAWSYEAVTGPMRWLSLAWEWYARRWTDQIACVSEQERRRGPWLRDNVDVVLVPNGVDLSRFTACDDDDRIVARRALGLSDGPTVVCVGRLCRQKGQDLLIAAWPYIEAAVADANLVLVGDGPLWSALRKAAPKNVRFCGAIDDPRPWYAAAHVVAMPSRWEGLALVHLEAIASGRCVVATTACGTPDAAVPVGDVRALAAGIIRRLRRPDLADAQAAAARVALCQEHDVTMATARMRSAYQLTISAASGARVPGARVGRIGLGAAR